MNTKNTLFQLGACAFLSSILVVVGMLVLRDAMRENILQHETETFLRQGQDHAALAAIVAEQYLDDPGRNQIALRTLVDGFARVHPWYTMAISGSGREDSGVRGRDHLWASNAPELRTADAGILYEPGISTPDDELSLRISEIAAQINSEGESALRELRMQIDEVSARVFETITRGGPDLDKELAEIDEILRVLHARATERSAALASGHAGTIPDIAGDGVGLPDELDELLFYHPVAIFGRDAENLYAGMVRLTVPTEEFNVRVRRQHEQLDLKLRPSLLIGLPLLLLMHLLVAVISRLRSRS